MAKEVTSNKGALKAGFWLFLLGLVIAILAGFMTLQPWLVSILVLLGLIVGFLNIASKEVMPFLWAAVSLVIVTSFGGNVLGSIGVIGPYLARILSAIVIFVVPATIIVALRVIYSLAHN